MVGINYEFRTKTAVGYWNESQYVPINKYCPYKVPISKYSLNATMFHYGLAIRTESYKIDKIHEFKTCGLTGC